MRGVRGATLSVLLALSVVSLAALAVLAHQGYRAYVVHTGSMMPTYNPGDVVINEPVGELRPGQVITFLHSSRSSDLVTHRITDIADGVIHTKGDGNRTADVWDIRPDQVRGAVVGSVPYLGYAFVYLKQPIGLASIVTVVVGAVLLWQLFFPVPAPAGSSPSPGSRDPGRRLSHVPARGGQLRRPGRRRAGSATGAATRGGRAADRHGLVGKHGVTWRVAQPSAALSGPARRAHLVDQGIGARSQGV